MNGYLKDFFDKAKLVNEIDISLYKKYQVKNGLRNEDGTGVLVGLTKISDVVGYEIVNNQKVDIPGKLIYSGIDVKELIDNFENSDNDLYEKVCFLLVFGYLPNKNEFAKFKNILASFYDLPQTFLENEILGFPSRNLMNKMQRDILALYNYDDLADDVSASNMLLQGLQVVAKMPSLMCYNYQNKIHYFNKASLFIHHSIRELSIAQNILLMLRSNQVFSQTEARVLDIALVLHADHGGGNNSTFVNVVMSSSGTDLYSALAGGVGSLKGPKHGGANLKVCEMMDEIINEIGYDASEKAIYEIVNRLLAKDFFDRSGLIYGMGHAVYTVSDPRSEILAKAAYDLAVEKNKLEEFEFYQKFEKIALAEILRLKNQVRCSNVDFYSGFVYEMLGLPREIYTLLFACSRSIGWVAHNIENKLYSNKIIRPATKYVGDIKVIEKE